MRRGAAPPFAPRTPQVSLKKGPGGPDRARCLTGRRRDDSRFIISDANRAAFEHFRARGACGWSKRRCLAARADRADPCWPVPSSRVGGRPFDGAESYDKRNCFTPECCPGQRQALGHDGRQGAPGLEKLGLPDLRTRHGVTPVAQIAQPDDKLFRLIIRLLFADCGPHMPDDCLKYIADREVERELLDGGADCRGDRTALPLLSEQGRPCRPSGGALAEEGIIDARRGMTIQGERSRRLPPGCSIAN